jgi:putative NIF3 family GTP cyclohydrolase 1 type 2
LPLDGHLTLGNNAQLGALLDFERQAFFGSQNIGWVGTSPHTTVGELAKQIQIKLRREVTVVGDWTQPIQTVAWCTGGAQGYFEEAIAAGADVYITGEISEPQAHYAREMGVAYIACGHHASERFGAAAVGAHVADHFGIKHTFIDIDNPA